MNKKRWENYYWMSNEDYLISQNNHKLAWERLKSIGAIPNDGKRYVLHHWDDTLRHNNVKRYIQWNLYDLDVMELSEHSKLHGINKVPWNKGLKGVQVAWNKGLTGCYVRNEETRKKMSLVRKGKPKSEEWRRKISESLNKYHKNKKKSLTN